MPHTDVQHQRRFELLASAVRSRMIELDLSQEALAMRASITAAVIGDIAAGKPKNYRSTTLAAVASGLNWHPLAPVAVLASDEAAANVGIDLPASGRRPGEATTGHAPVAM